MASAADSSDFARKLGSLLAAEEPCGLNYDQNAISAVIEKNVKADDMEFGSDMNNYTGLAKFQIEQMSTSSKGAFCTQQSRVAKALGLVK